MAKTEKPDAALENIDVREVSVVDRPAIRRKFLIVKRDTMEESMPDKVITDEDIFDAVDHILKDSKDEETQEEIVKVTVGQTLKVLTASLQSLMASTKQIKALGDQPVTSEISSKLKSIAAAITGIVGASDKTEKIKGTTLQAATTALDRLMSMVSKIKGMDASSDLESSVAGELKAIASLIGGMASQPAAKVEEKIEKEEEVIDEEIEEDLEVFKSLSSGDEEDPEIIIKAGSKMKRQRLSAFRKAVDTLVSLLKELEGQPQEKDEKMETKKAAVSEEWMAGITKTINEFTEKMSELGKSMTEKIEALQKRVDEFDNVRPSGEGDEDEEIQEVKKNLWAGVL
jgi:hypothetical protein